MGCLSLLLSREKRGASGCGSHPHGPAPEGTNSLFPRVEHVSTKQDPTPGAQGRKTETRDLEMIAGRLLSPSPCAAEPSPHFCPNLPQETFLGASDSLSASVSLRLQSALPFLPGDVSSHGQHLSDPQTMSSIPSLIFCKFLGNSNPAETSPGQGSRHWIQNHSASPQTLRAAPRSAQCADDVIPQ